MSLEHACVSTMINCRDRDPLDNNRYWLFNADDYLKYAKMEDWGPLPVEKRSSRGALVFAANAYLDAFLEGKLDLVPWGFHAFVSKAVRTQVKEALMTVVKLVFQPE